MQNSFLPIWLAITQQLPSIVPELQATYKPWYQLDRVLPLIWRMYVHTYVVIRTYSYLYLWELYHVGISTCYSESVDGWLCLDKSSSTKINFVTMINSNRKNYFESIDSCNFLSFKFLEVIESFQRSFFASSKAQSKNISFVEISFNGSSSFLTIK